VIRVLIADDEALVRDGLAAILASEDDIAVLGEATDGGEAVALTLRLRPDVVLMDIRMPRMDGIDATREIHRIADQHAKVLILTTFGVDEYVYDALRAGASGFLLKDARKDELVSAIRTVSGGDALLAPAITRKLIDDVIAATPSPQGSDALAALTERELEVFSLLTAGLSNSEIGSRLYLSEPTIKTHVGSILRKLGLRDRVQAVILAYECGYIKPGRDG